MTNALAPGRDELSESPLSPDDQTRATTWHLVTVSVGLMWSCIVVKGVITGYGDPTSAVRWFFGLAGMVWAGMRALEFWHTVRARSRCR